MTSKNVTTRRRYQSVVIGDLHRPLGVVRSEKKDPFGALRSLTHSGSRTVSLKVDVPLMLTVITLLVFGIIMVYSASYDYSRYHNGAPFEMFYRQLLWLAIGSVVMVVAFLIDYHHWTRFAAIALVVTVLMLLFVLIAGKPMNFAIRAIFGASVQPSELAKVVTVFYLSVWLYAKRERLKDINFGLLPLSVIIGGLTFLIGVQPDLSAAITIMMLGGLMFFLAGGDLKQISLLIVGALVVGTLLIMIFPTGLDRIEKFIGGIKDPTTGSYHVQRAFGSLAEGGWFGVGIGEAVGKHTGLPVAPTDSIFAVVGEETGVAGAVGLIGLYMALLWRGLTIARRAPDQLGALLAGGLSFWITLEAFINMAVMVNLLPFAGNALPFISYGGSNLVVMMASTGLILNISRLSVESREDRGRLFNAIVNLRRRDGRRRVSGAGSAASAGPRSRSAAGVRQRRGGPPQP
jgi:cell division protein FtsW